MRRRGARHRRPAERPQYTLTVRGIVELFRAVKREDKVNREILAFSVSYNHQPVRIYGHYPVITGKDTSITGTRSEILFLLRWTAGKVDSVPIHQEHLGHIGAQAF